MSLSADRDLAIWPGNNARADNDDRNEKVSVEIDENHDDNPANKEKEETGPCAVDTTESTREWLTSCRWVLAYMASAMTLLLMCQRHCLSMAIVCMSHACRVRPIEDEEAGGGGGGDGRAWSNNATSNAAATWTDSSVTWEEGEVTSSPGGRMPNDTRAVEKRREKVKRARERRWALPSQCWPERNGVSSASLPYDQKMFCTAYISDDMQGVVFSSYYYGYLATSLIGGLIAAKVGPKRTLTIAMAMSAVLTLLTPVVVRFNVYLTVVLRAALGLVSGVIMPSIVSMWAFWAPREEKAILLTVTFTGSSTGNIVANFVSGFLCSIPLDEGWPFIFYTYGCTTVLWVVVWYFVAFDIPEVHPRITDKERVFIERMRSSNPNVKVSRPSLKAVFTSPAFLSLLVTHMSYTWFLGTIATYIPIYFNDILRFDTEVTGMMSSLPFVVRIVFSVMFAVLADRVAARGLLSVTLNRKLFQCVGLVIPGALVIAVGFLTSDMKIEAVTLMTLVASFQSACMSGFRINHLDIAPRFAGSLSGITVSFATASNIFSPVVVSSMIADKQQASWRNVFTMTALQAFAGALLFAVFGSGEEQEWAKIEVNKTTQLPASEHKGELPVPRMAPAVTEIETEPLPKSGSALDNGGFNLTSGDETESDVNIGSEKRNTRL